MKACFFLLGVVAALKYTQVLGPAIQYTLTWDPPAQGQCSMCISAQINTSNWIGIGFRAPGMTEMNGTDIVVGLTTYDGRGLVKTMYSNDTEGYPGGVNTLQVSATSFGVVGKVTTLCFTRLISSGHVSLTDSTQVIWANGPVLNDDLNYHGFDDSDPTGKTQQHRSDEIPPIRFYSGPSF